MLTLLSPAKNLNFDPAPDAPPATKPLLGKEAGELAAVAKNLSAAQLKKLMGISDKLAELNRARFSAFGTKNVEASKQAALAFNGDVYLGLEAKSFDKKDFAFAQEHLRILSGLYGLLRPLDAIEPYRLEMGSRLKNPKGGDLYAYWDATIAREIDKLVAGHKDKTIVNLASQEYFAAVDRDALKAPVITALFKEEKDGELRQLQFFAKRARGMMARWIILNRIDKAADLKGFNEDGYKLRADLSDADTLLFTRKQPPLKQKPRKKA